MKSAWPRFRQDTAPPLSIFEPDTLACIEAYQGYRSATPYAHAIFDDLFDPEALRMILREWPNDSLEQHNDGTFVRKKQGTTWKTQFGPYTSRYLADLASPQLLLALEKLTGIWGLIPDSLPLWRWAARDCLRRKARRPRGLQQAFSIQAGTPAEHAGLFE